MHNVRNWHEQQGLAAFQNEADSAPRPSLPASPVASSLMEVQEIAANVASSEQAVEMAFAVYERGIQHSRSQQSAPLAIAEQEASIRALELAQHETLKAVSKFEFHKTSIEFAKKSAQRNLDYVRPEQAQWQGIAQQINATHDRYIALSATIAPRHRALHDQAEALLLEAQEQWGLFNPRQCPPSSLLRAKGKTCGSTIISSSFPPNQSLTRCTSYSQVDGEHPVQPVQYEAFDHVHRQLQSSGRDRVTV